MKARINTFAFRQTDLDSARLSVLGTIAHPVLDPGTYVGSVLLVDVEIARFRLRVEKEHDRSQADVDLASLVAHRRAAAERGTERDFAMRAGGYLVLYVSEGPGGYQVLLDRLATKEDEKIQRTFDSRFLMPEDVFVASILRPGSYAMSVQDGRAKGSIRVTYPDPGKGRYVPEGPAKVAVTKEGFEPAQLIIGPAQGVVFAIQTEKTTISIKLEEPDDGGRVERRRDTFRWTNPRPPNG